MREVIEIIVTETLFASNRSCVQGSRESMRGSKIDDNAIAKESKTAQSKGVVLIPASIGDRQRQERSDSNEKKEGTKEQTLRYLRRLRDDHGADLTCIKYPVGQLQKWTASMPHEAVW